MVWNRDRLILKTLPLLSLNLCSQGTSYITCREAEFITISVLTWLLTDCGRGPMPTLTGLRMRKIS